MEPKRYWWIRYKSTAQGMYAEYERVSDMHPFQYCSSHMSLVLINWKLIDVTEYNLWNELNNNQ